MLTDTVVVEIRAEWGERGWGEELQSVMSVDVDRQTLSSWK